MKINEALVGSIAIGVIVAIFGAVILRVMFVNLGFPGEHSNNFTGSYLEVFPYLFGAVVGLAARSFSHKALSRQL